MPCDHDRLIILIELNSHDHIHCSNIHLGYSIQLYSWIPFHIGRSRPQLLKTEITIVETDISIVWSVNVWPGSVLQTNIDRHLPILQVLEILVQRRVKHTWVFKLVKVDLTTDWQCENSRLACFFLRNRRITWHSTLNACHCSSLSRQVRKWELL